jgi:hypothetical protein
MLKMSLEKDLTSRSDHSDSCGVAISATPITDEISCSLVPDKNQAEPASVEEALDSPIWRNSMDEEYKALINHGTWEVVPAPANTNIVGNRWVFIWKHDQQGETH